MEKEEIMFMAEDTFSGPFWTRGGACDIGSCTTIFLENGDEIDVSSITEIESWYAQADNYDPYSAVEEFQHEGFQNWVIEEFEIVEKIRKILPTEVELYYGFMHEFGLGKWGFCETRIN